MENKKKDLKNAVDLLLHMIFHPFYFLFFFLFFLGTLSREGVVFQVSFFSINARNDWIWQVIAVPCFFSESRLSNV